MIKVKINKQINEMALGTYRTIGDFTKPITFEGPDHKIATHPGFLRKLEKFFSRTEYIFNFYMINKEIIKIDDKEVSSKRLKIGEIDKKFANKLLFYNDGKNEINEFNKKVDGSITIIFLGNYGDDKVMLTPWIIAHRIGHTIYDEADENNEFGKIIEQFYFLIEKLLKQNYNYNLDQYDLGTLRDVFELLGTQKSSRDKKLERPLEFFHECFAQYILKKQVIFNSFPRQIKAQNNVNLTTQLPDEELLKISKELSAFLTNHFQRLLNNQIGKIFLV